MRLASADLDLAGLHPALSDPTMRSMTFLNEIADRHPGAISFAPGRPYDGFFELPALDRYFQLFVRHSIEHKGLTSDQLARQMFQYGRTKGIIHDLIARHLAVDEGMHVDPESIVVTVGCQEAMLLVLLALRSGPDDVVLAVEPTYVGLAGSAALAGLPVMPVRDGPDGIDLEHLEGQIGAARAAGRRPRALYVVSDFANPSGKVLPLRARHGLLEVASASGVLVLEDNPYRLFGDSDGALPTLKALDRDRTVVHLGSLSKSCLPGARIGYAVADQEIVQPGGARTLFADELAKVKSMVTVNTSPIVQAIAGGRLLEHGCSLVAGNAREIEVYRRNRRVLLDALAASFPAGGSTGVTWTAPEGGFFVVLSVPFEADAEALDESAREFGVLWTPMRDFYRFGGGARQLRLSCSTLEPRGITDGVRRLAAFVERRTAHLGGGRSVAT
ncbi:PLP-dependent aminotransferase family protein [Plantactinospora sp. WMMB334]|uniref:aminotransferase-like domain-containing protein n=1 Tax=Plantactinospora sp. WMMB334 TaxID=3404119 RepID=UPI003B93C2AB